MPRYAERRLAAFAAFLAVLAADVAGAQEPEEAVALRPLSPDRPDITESPHSVDQGHFQLEMDVFTSERDDGDASLAFAVTNLKVGVASFLDLQLVLHPIVSGPTTNAGEGRTFGYGDPIVRVKTALFGNDDGPFALGAIAFARIPVGGSSGELDTTGSVDRVFEGGLALPMGFDLPRGFSLGAMVELDISRNAAFDGHHPELLGTVTLGHTIVGPLSGFLEGTARLVVDESVFGVATVDVGLVYEIHESFVLDAGAYIGLTETAPDVVSFVGTTIRI